VRAAIAREQRGERWAEKPQEWSTARKIENPDYTQKEGRATCSTGRGPCIRQAVGETLFRAAMTLGNAATAHVRLIAWGKDCKHQGEPDPVEQLSATAAKTAASNGETGAVISS